MSATRADADAAADRVAGIAGVEITTPPPPAPGALTLAPVGMASALGTAASLTVSGGRVVEALSEIETGQAALLIAPTGDAGVSLSYRYAPAPQAARYPEAAFAWRRNRYTEPAEDLAGASRDIAEAAGGGAAGIEALVAEARARFTYGHPEDRFNDGCALVPWLGCGTAAGSCVDINTYLVASLRAAGYEAAYLYGYFFPEERGGVTSDAHCWIATRHEGVLLEWDVAHHIKAGLDPVRPALNPRPGERVVIGHSMGHRYVSGDVEIALKLLSEPVWRLPDGTIAAPDQASIRIAGPATPKTRAAGALEAAG